MLDQDTNDQVVRVMASRNSVAVQTTSGKVQTDPVVENLFNTYCMSAYVYIHA